MHASFQVYVAAVVACLQGRGYPDLASRLFVKALHRAKPNLPVVFLCDYDPHGVNIMLNYIFGSISDLTVRKAPN